MDYTFKKGVHFKETIKKLQDEFPKAKIVFDKDLSEKNIEKTLIITGLTAEQEAQAEEKIIGIVDNNIVHEFEKSVCSKCLTNAILADYPSARIAFDCLPEDVLEIKKKKIIIDDCNISHEALANLIESDYSACDCENKNKSADVCLPEQTKKAVKSLLVLTGKTWDEFDAEFKNQ